MSSRCDRLRGAVTVSEVRPDQTQCSQYLEFKLIALRSRGFSFPAEWCTLSGLFSLCQWDVAWIASLTSGILVLDTRFDAAERFEVSAPSELVCFAQLFQESGQFLNRLTAHSYISPFCRIIWSLNFQVLRCKNPLNGAERNRSQCCGFNREKQHVQQYVVKTTQLQSVELIFFRDSRSLVTCVCPKSHLTGFNSPIFWCCFALLRSTITRDAFHFPCACSQSNLISLTLKKTWSEPWKCAVPGASRCMDSAVACHFGDNWSALRDHCLSATAGLESCQECCWVRENVVAHACHIQYEQSLSLSSVHAIGRPPILTSQFNLRQEKGISVNLFIPEFSFLWENSEPGFIFQKCDLH